MKRKLVRSAAAFALALGLSVSMLPLGSPASASEKPFDAPVSFAATGEKLVVQQRSSQKDEICEQARKISGIEGECRTEVSVSSTEPMVIKASTLSAQELNLKSADGVSLKAAAAAGSTIKSKNWSNSMRGLYYVNWLEKHSGTVYWDGTRVWSTTKNRGKKGKHVCDQGFGVGYNVNVKKCFTEVVSKTMIKEWDYYQVHVLFKGVPLYMSHDMHTVFRNTGSMKHYS